jgi:hypothetical protein
VYAEPSHLPCFISGYSVYLYKRNVELERRLREVGSGFAAMHAHSSMQHPVIGCR